ncbi:MAG: hypothetical protein JXO51_05350, partial [Candidatus Aminicenantes bacterium]|nr:hypothetical protein [Candidatus Aminicenantes bacterium]
RLAMLLPLCGAALMPAAEFKVTCTPQMSPALVLPAPAKIMKVTWTTGIKGYTIWKDGTPFVTVHPYRLEEGNGVKGVLPPGRYILRATGGSVTIHLQTGYSPEKITLWGIQNAVVTPRTDGNRIVLATPTAIVEAAYDGTDGMGIFMGDKRVLYYVSPHNVRNHGPKVIGGTGGKTLVGQVLPAGVYMLVPGRGTATGRVFGKVVLEVK